MDKRRLPGYAQSKNPNPARLVRRLCKNGDCSKGGLSWAEMTHWIALVGRS